MNWTINIFGTKVYSNFNTTLVLRDVEPKNLSQVDDTAILKSVMPAPSLTG